MSSRFSKLRWFLRPAVVLCLPAILLLGTISAPQATLEAGLPMHTAQAVYLPAHFPAEPRAPQELPDPFYPDHPDVLGQLHDLAASHPDIAHYRVLGQGTHTGRDIAALKISDNVNDNEDEPAWIFTGFIHGSEQLGLRVLLNLADLLVNDYGDLPKVTNWVNAYEIWIVIDLNPWAYDHDEDGNHDVLGTRKHGPNTGNVNTSGVNLARNYDFRWDHGGTTDPDDRDFRGPYAFSEQETQLIRDFFLEQRPIFGITFHQGNDPDGGQIMRPWRNDGIDYPPDSERLLAIAELYADWVYDARDNGSLCNGQLTDPHGDDGCDDPEGLGDGPNGGDIEYCSNLCWEPTQSGLGPFGQPSNWYYAAVGTFDYTVEISDDTFNGDFMHDAAGPGNANEEAVKEIATTFMRNHLAAIQSWFDYFIHAHNPDFVFEGPGLTGHVTDAVTGAPLSATIEVGGFTSAWIQPRTSDGKFGRYWRLLPAGTYPVTVTKSGYTTWTQSKVTVGSGPLTVLDVALTPDLEILSPDATHTAWVGEPSEARTFTVRVRLAGGGTPCHGPQHFDVFVRDETAAWIVAPDGAQACVQDTYWISVQAPEAGHGSFVAGGVYDLKVTLDPASDESPQSVRYEDRLVDTILIMDVSGSMGEAGKLDAAKEAAVLLTDELVENDQAGLVWFSGDGAEPNRDADTVFELTPMTASNQLSLITAIQGLALRNLTSIGDGLAEALDESLSKRARLDYACDLVLLSDGMENEAAYWADVQARAAESRCLIHTIALGPETDELLLQTISRKGTRSPFDDGSYFYATISDAATAEASAGAAWPNALAGIYDDIAARRAGRQRFFKTAGIVSRTPRSFPILLDASVTDAVFALKWNGLADAGRLELRQPDGAILLPNAPGVTHRASATDEVFRVAQPMTGTWQARVMNLKAAEGDLPFILLASGRSAIEFQVFTSAAVTLTQQGDAVHFLGLLTDHTRPITAANVRVVIEAADGVRNTLRLFDDGKHKDGSANDGFYANVYDRVIAGDQVDPEHPERGGLQARGSFVWEAVARGPGFQRFANGSFAVTPSPDADHDGLPDPWEQVHGLDPFKPDAGADPDLDGLTNVQEFQAGTDPHDSDTDDGGEADGSEMSAGRDPLWPDDDAIPPVTGFALSALPQAAAITWTPHISHTAYLLWRREVSGTWGLVSQALPRTGVYTDTGLTNGVTYEYTLAAQGASGQRSGNTGPLSITPVADPFPPRGRVLINGGAAVAHTRQLSLTLQADPDTTEMRLGSEINDGTDEIGGAWRPFRPQLGWLIPRSFPTGATWVIYAQFRDAAGNTSEVVKDNIRYGPLSRRYLPLVKR